MTPAPPIRSPGRSAPPAARRSPTPPAPPDRRANFSSLAGLRGISGQSNYGAAKAGIAGLTRVVARDLGRYGVTCNAIAPRAQTRLTATGPGAARPPPPHPG